jgi:alpha-ketoglutarate-dependent taurine dioxygenase
VDRAERDRILGELFQHLYAPERIYLHDWQLYDLLIWDNLAVQHARTKDADVAEGERALQRVALNEMTYSELIARAQQREDSLQVAKAPLAR